MPGWIVFAPGFTAIFSVGIMEADARIRSGDFPIPGGD
jgi:hypothetical protein